MIRVHPIARLGLARILVRRSPHLTPERAVRNADDIIRALHDIGLQVGPIDCFGPHASDARVDLDAVGLMADLYEQEMGRKPWRPD